jgi:glycosyltransferase involved in cell wall biosynthesis
MRSELGLLSTRAADTTTVVPGAIDSDRFCPGPRRADLVTGRGPHLFTARRLTPRTGVDELVQAMPRVLETFPDATLSIAGRGPMEAEISKQVAGLGLTDVVRLLGRISDHELVDWYRTATLVVMPTRELEGFGLMTAEALACGAAVVGTPAGATPELLRPLDGALVTSDTTAESMARAIVRLVSDRAGLDLIRSAARRRVIPQMDWDHVVDRHLQIYAAMVSAAPTRRSSHAGRRAQRRLSVSRGWR